MKMPTTPSRLIDNSNPDRYAVYDSLHKRLQVFAVVDNGELSLTMRTRLEDGTRSPLLRGAEQFARVLSHFSGTFIGIQGSWSFGDNLAAFNRATAGGMSPENAALQTWTGKQAGAAGYRRVMVRSLEGQPGAYTRVKVVFLR